MTIPEQIALTEIFYFWAGFCLMQVHQQKRAGMVSTTIVQRTYFKKIHLSS